MKRNYLFGEQNDENKSEMIFEIFMTNGNPVIDTSKGKSILIIEIRKREGMNIPHFHFTKNYGNNREGCIRLDQALYFNHGDYYKATLNDQEAYVLNQWMGQPCPLKNADGKSNWAYMKEFWNNNPYDQKIKTKSQPDYAKINYNY